VGETLQFLDCICGSTTGGLGLLGLYINESNAFLVDQTLASLIEYCQGPCHENQAWYTTCPRWIRATAIFVITLADKCTILNNFLPLHSFYRWTGEQDFRWNKSVHFALILLLHYSVKSEKVALIFLLLNMHCDSLLSHVVLVLIFQDWVYLLTFVLFITTGVPLASLWDLFCLHSMLTCCVIIIITLVLIARIVQHLLKQRGNTLDQWFSTEVSRNPRVPRASAKGSAAGQ